MKFARCGYWLLPLRFYFRVVPRMLLFPLFSLVDDDFAASPAPLSLILPSFASVDRAPPVELYLLQ